MLKKYTAQVTLLLTVTFITNNCGNGGNKIQDSASLGSVADISGSIASQSGSQSEMAGWMLVLVNHSNSVSRVTEIDQTGQFTFKHVFLNQYYSLVLLSQSSIIRAVLAHPSQQEGKVQQVFKITAQTLPRLIHKGSILNFQNFNGIQLANDLAKDSNRDGAPDGTSAFELYANQDPIQLVASEDASNGKDSDIDNDGLPNVFDPDSDGDGALNHFDSDANGDAVLDNQQETGHLYFNKGFEWIMVRYEMTPIENNQYQRELTLLAKLHKSQISTPLSVQVRGPASLLNGSTVDVTDDQGTTIPIAWDGLLHDDGQSHDEGAADLLFARKIKLKAGSSPSANQVIFFQLPFGSAENPWFQEFAYTFAPITPSSITPEYISANRTVRLSGNPFDEIQDFVWFVTVYQSSGSGLVKTYSSKSLPGADRQFILPENTFETGQSYQYKIAAQVLDGVPGHAAYRIETQLTTINAAP